jgi:cyclase
MLKVRVIPCLLLKNGALVKTIRFKNLTYIGDPINTVRIYNEKEVDELIFLDITATVENRQPPLKIISEISLECFMPFTYGGGIRSVQDAEKIFSMGAEKVSVNSSCFSNPQLITDIARIFGNQAVVASIDVRKNFIGQYRVYSRSGTVPTKTDPADFAKTMETYGAGEILLTSIDQDGMMEGYDLTLIKKVTSAVSIPVIVCGGAGNIDHLVEAVKTGGASAVAAGSIFVYQKKNRAVLINYPDRKILEEKLN